MMVRYNLILSSYQPKHDMQLVNHKPHRALPLQLPLHECPLTMCFSCLFIFFKIISKSWCIEKWTLIKDYFVIHKSTYMSERSNKVLFIQTYLTFQTKYLSLNVLLEKFRNSVIKMIFGYIYRTLAFIVDVSKRDTVAFLSWHFSGFQNIWIIKILISSLSALIDFETILYWLYPFW